MIRKAFTIIELIVVMGIMLILLAIVLPAIKSLTRNNNQKQATNMLVALIDNAHALAVQSHTPAGIVIYEDPSQTGQSSVQLIVQSSQSELRYFVRAPRTGSQSFPVGIKLAMLDDSVIGMRTESSTSDTKCRVILFNGEGQMILVDSLAHDPTVMDAAAIAWNLNATTGAANHSKGVSGPGLVVYNGNDMQAATNNGVITDATTRANWLKANSDVLIVNAYTGGIIR